MGERAQDVDTAGQEVDTAGLEEELDRSRRLIDDAKAAAGELAEATPDPHRTESPEHRPAGVDPFGGTREQGGGEPGR